MTSEAGSDFLCNRFSRCRRQSRKVSLRFLQTLGRRAFQPEPSLGGVVFASDIAREEFCLDSALQSSLQEAVSVTHSVGDKLLARANQH